jgi:hypothetical protein
VNALESSAAGQTQFSTTCLLLFTRGDEKDFIVYNGDMSYGGLEVFLNSHYRKLLNRKHDGDVSLYEQVSVLDGAAGFDRDSPARFFAISLLRGGVDGGGEREQQLAELQALARSLSRDKVRTVYVEHPEQAAEQLGVFEGVKELLTAPDPQHAGLSVLIFVRPRVMRYHVCVSAGGVGGQLMQLCTERVLAGDVKWSQLESLPVFV